MKYKIKIITAICIVAILSTAFIIAKQHITNADFGKTFGTKAAAAQKKLHQLQTSFNLCSATCNKSSVFLQSIVFPEVMRYNELKDNIETESLKTLYVQFGEEYANFSIGLFQMKPTFAQQVEEKAKQLLPDSIYAELQLKYDDVDTDLKRLERVERLEDTEWQLVYLTAFICICDKIYQSKTFNNNSEKIQWYATVYNAGFDKTNTYITKKIEEDNFYLSQNMPGKKFKYAAIAQYYYSQQHKK